MAITNQIRFAKVFTGTKREARYKTVMQQLLPNPSDDGPMQIWVEVPTVWASPEDEAKYLAAETYEYLRSHR